MKFTAAPRADWNGMACVLTVALIEDDEVTVGHVGDSRLYLLRPGEIVKITHDHSPVGEREDRGEIGEEEAMRHARRNEIYRDLGSSERGPHDPLFIEIVAFPLPWDGALLLCSDGLSDLVGSAEIRAGVERSAPDYDKAIKALIDAANHAGGKDNITVVVAAAPGYVPRPPMSHPSLTPSPDFPCSAMAHLGSRRLRRAWPAQSSGYLIPLIRVRSHLRTGGPRTILLSVPRGINDGAPRSPIPATP